MTYQEKKSIVNMASTLLVYGIYYWFVYQRYDPVGMTPEELLQFWGKTIITIIPFAIGGKIVIHVIFVISNKIITKENHPDFEDERDKLITLKSARKLILHIWNEFSYWHDTDGLGVFIGDTIYHLCYWRHIIRCI